jgi:uncharacterized surface protein with fasciclin (FAS1) repeats
MSFFTGQNKDNEYFLNKGTIADYLLTEFKNSDFLKLVNKADLIKLLNNNQAHFTLFLPRIVDNTIDINDSKQIVNCAIIPRLIDSKILKSTPVSYFNTRNLTMRMFVHNLEDEIIINCASKILKPDICCTNGIIHIIDNILLPNDKHFVN